MGSSGEKTKKAPRKTTRDKTGLKEVRRVEVGAALRTVYQKTVEENVPSEMLDLLRKLG